MKTKTFTVTITKAFEDSLKASNVKLALETDRRFLGASVTVHEVNETSECDGCGKERRDVKACGKDANGEPDAPDLCFICRKENEKRRHWSRSLGRYVPWAG